MTGVGRCRPAPEEVECLGRAAAGLGAEDGQAQAAVGRELHDLVVELEVAHGWVMQPLIVVLWRAGLRISEALALPESDLDRECSLAWKR